MKKHFKLNKLFLMFTILFLLASNFPKIPNAQIYSECDPNLEYEVYSIDSPVHSK